MNIATKFRNFSSNIYSNTIGKSRVKKNDSSPEVHPIETTSNSETKNASEQPICRICMDDTVVDMIAPCLCSGSSKFVHRSCLDKWRSSPSSNYSKFNECGVCKFKYEYIRDYSKSKFKLFLNKLKEHFYLLVRLTFVIIGILMICYTAGLAVRNDFNNWIQNLSNSSIVATNIGIGIAIIDGLIGLSAEIAFIIYLLSKDNDVDDELLIENEENEEQNQQLIHADREEQNPMVNLPLVVENIAHIQEPDADIQELKVQVEDVLYNEIKGEDAVRVEIKADYEVYEAGVEQDKVEQDKVEQLEIEQDKVEQDKVEQLEIEQVEAPQVEAPQVEVEAPHPEQENDNPYVFYMKILSNIWFFWSYIALILLALSVMLATFVIIIPIAGTSIIVILLFIFVAYEYSNHKNKILALTLDSKIHIVKDLNEQLVVVS
jgi:hypothetical protein